MLLFLVLFALWLLLNGRVTLELILIGAAVSGAVWLFYYRTLGYWPQRERVLLRRLPRYAHYTAALAVEDEDFLVLCLDAESADALPDWKLTTMLTKMEEETCS